MAVRTEYVVWNAATQAAQRRAQQRRVTVLILVCSVVAGALLGGGHAEEPLLARPLGYCEGAEYLADCVYPWWLHWAVGVGGGLLFCLLLAPLIPLAPRRVVPELHCRRCGSRGWIDDLVETGGKCPRCAGERFDLDEVALSQVPAAESILFLPHRTRRLDVSGAELLASRQPRRKRK